MATISEERLREMEEEMDRFEAEIQTPGQPPSFILGASTFDKVQAQLTSIRQETSRQQQAKEEEECNPYGDEDLRQPNWEDVDEGYHRYAGNGDTLHSRKRYEMTAAAGNEFHDIDERPGRPQGPLAPPPPPPPPPPPSNVPSRPPSHVPSKLGEIPLSTVLAPPPPPPPRPDGGGLQHSTLSFEPYPPGEGPTRPVFMPPQLRHRMPPRPPPGHRPPFPRPPMGMGGLPPGPFPRPPGLPPPPPPAYMPMEGGMPMGPGVVMPGQPQGMAGMGMPMQGEEIRHSPVVEKPKVVYSAAPVISVESKKGDKKAKKKKKSSKADGQQDSLKSETSRNVSGSAPSSSTANMEEDTSIADMEIVPANTMIGGIMAASVNQSAVSGVGMPTGGKKEKKKKEKKFIRMAASTTWEDPTLSDWTQDDFRMFCGDLGNEVTDETLVRAFNKYPSFLKAKVVRDRRSNKSKGYGFVSFKDPMDFARAMREMNGKYVGNRPIKLRKSTWKDRSIEVVRKKDKEKKRLGLR